MPQGIAATTTCSWHARRCPSFLTVLMKSMLTRFKKIRLFLPESFEWLVLNSSLFSDARTRDILLNPADHIESADFFSWEQFFTKELVEITAGTYLAYQKKSLNTAYLQPKEMTALKEQLPNLGI